MIADAAVFDVYAGAELAGQKSVAVTVTIQPTDKTLTDPDALRAEIQHIRAIGYALDDGEFLEGMNAAAVPIKDIQGRLVSTLAVHGPAQRMSMSQAEEYLLPLREAAQELALLFNGEAPAGD